MCRVFEEGNAIFDALRLRPTVEYLTYLWLAIGRDGELRLVVDETERTTVWREAAAPLPTRAETFRKARL